MFGASRAGSPGTPEGTKRRLPVGSGPILDTRQRKQVIVRTWADYEISGDERKIPDQAEILRPPSPIDRSLYLQRSLGNQSLQAMSAPGAIRAEPSIAVDEQRTVRRQPNQRCALSSNTDNIATEKTANAPSSYYGASFNHKFVSEPEGCSLAGVQISEYVTTDRDDFNLGRPTVALGRKIWTLTRENKLNEADRIWTEAGARGLGAGPVNRWPAVLDQNQLWYYRHSPNDSWNLGPGTVIKLTLHGDRSRRETLRVTTTDHGVSRDEPYRGPEVRMRE